MTTYPDLAGQDDVYGLSQSTSSSPHAVSTANLVVHIEQSPTALARIFSLLCTFSLVPATISLSKSFGECNSLSLSFENIHRDRIDLLRRKMSQLTETLDIEHSFA